MPRGPTSPKLPLLSRGYNLYITCEQHIDFTTEQLEGGGGELQRHFLWLLLLFEGEMCWC